MRHPIPILLYHHVNDAGGSSTTGTAAFAAHLQFLAESGFRSLRLAELEAALHRGIDPGPRRFLLSFDDGSADLVNCAPAIAHYGFTAVAFVITGKLGEGPRYLTWPQLRALHTSGIFEIQSHSHSHSRWPLDSQGLQTATAELLLSREALSSGLDVPAAGLNQLAWPWGRCNPAFESAALQAGFTSQYLVQRGAVTLTGSSLRLPRLCCDGLSQRELRFWVPLLAAGMGARLSNLCFGGLRQWRHGLGYTGLRTAA